MPLHAEMKRKRSGISAKYGKSTEAQHIIAMHILLGRMRESHRWQKPLQQSSTHGLLLAYHEEDTIISPPRPWWQHWWVWLTALVLLIVLVWLSTRWYEKLRNRRNMIRLQHEKLQKEHQIEVIRQKAIQADSSELSSDIVKMTEQTGPDKRLTFRTASGTLIVDIKDIAFFKGDGNYSQIVTFNVKDTVLTGLGTLEKQLDPSTFVRADRSTLVNIHYISSLLPKQHRCIFRSPSGQEVETTLLNPAFKRLQTLL